MGSYNNMRDWSKGKKVSSSNSLNEGTTSTADSNSINSSSNGPSESSELAPQSSFASKSSHSSTQNDSRPPPLRPPVTTPGASATATTVETPVLSKASPMPTVILEEDKDLLPASTASTNLNTKYPLWRRSPQRDQPADTTSLTASSLASSSMASTKQSSIFSRLGSAVTKSTNASSRYSAKDQLSRLMTLVEPDEYSPAEETQNEKHQVKPRRLSRTAPVNGSRAMPEVVVDPLTSNAARQQASWANRAVPQTFAQDSQEVSTNTASLAARQQPTFSSTSLQGQNHLIISNELKRLSETLIAHFQHAINNISDIAMLSSFINMLIVKTIQSTSLQSVEPGMISLNSEPSLQVIIRVVLHFTDNILNIPAHQGMRHVLLGTLYELGAKLRILPENNTSDPSPSHLATNFAVGSIPKLACQEQVQQVLDLILSYPSENTLDQEGSFIAPVLRGFRPEFSVLSLIFGFPNPNSDHLKQVSVLYEFKPDVHILCQKNYIRACSSTEACGQFKVPFRIPTDPNVPPISMSLSKSSKATASGTLGGYIFPKVNSADSRFAQFAKSTFAITCAHVCIDNNHKSGTSVNVPSLVLANLYRNALAKHRNKFSPGTTEYSTYNAAIEDINHKVHIQSAREFGHVVWGERTVINKSLSDVAIIKCRDDLTCRNFLGDDISFSEYDPGLMFGNLHVRKILDNPTPGLRVFKYGSTTKYTSGRLNGPRMVYWADGRLQSSEFVVASDGPGFARGGDSGAWILHKTKDDDDDELNISGNEEDSNLTEKLSDFSSTNPTSTASVGITNTTGTLPTDPSTGPSLGVVGMLHSYDGERKEFGLYTPMTTILNRLEEVTHVKWGIVGVTDKDEDVPVGGSDSSEDDEVIFTDGE